MRLSRIVRVSGLLLVSCAGWLAVPAPASAAPYVAVWTSYLRVGPSEHDHVLDGITRGTLVEVVSCSNGWCLVRVGGTQGYLSSDAFSQRGTPLAPYALRQSNGTDCFGMRTPDRQDLHSNEICGAKGSP